MLYFALHYVSATGNPVIFQAGFVVELDWICSVILLISDTASPEILCIGSVPSPFRFILFC